MRKVRHKIKFPVIFILCLIPLNIYRLNGQSNNGSIDITYYGLNLEVSDTSTFISGFCDINLINKTEFLDQVVLEMSQNLVIDSIMILDNPVEYSHQNDTLAIFNVNKSLDEISIRVYYAGDGKGIQNYGVNNTYMGTWNQNITWTLSEPFYSKNWFPVKQDLNDKADSVAVTMTVDSGIIAVSNGLLYDKIILNDNRTSFVWKSYYPTAYYLISMAVSKYRQYDISTVIDNDTIKVTNFIYNSDDFLNKNEEYILETTRLLEIYSQLFGKYPFSKEKYGHAMAPLGGGMEHQTITTISDFNFKLVAHELAHQWWGNLVTCSAWEDIWINEGFASYAEYLAYEYLGQTENAKSWLQNTIISVLVENSGSVYVNDYPTSTYRLFSKRLSYNKGAIVIHMLREKIGNDELFFKTLKTFLSEFSFSSAGTKEFIDIAERVTGIDLSDFFNDWIYGEGFPEIQIQWTQTEDGVKITVLSDKAYDLTIPITIHAFSNNELKTLLKINGYNTEQEIEFDGLIKNIVWNGQDQVLAKLNSISRETNDLIDDRFKLIQNYREKTLTLYNFQSLPYTVTIYNIMGSEVYSKLVEDDFISIDLGQFVRSVYILEIVLSDNKKYTMSISNIN